MKRLWRLYFLLALASGCSQQRLQGSSPTDPLARPSWIENPQENCLENQEICASAQAKSQLEADVQAKNDLAAYFKTEISSELQDFQTMSQSSDFSEQKSLSFSENEINQKVHQILVGVFVAHRYHDPEGDYYSFAKLDKEMMNAEILTKMKRIEEQMNELFHWQSRSSYINLISLYKLWQEQNLVFRLLNKVKKQPPYSLEEITTFLSSSPKKIVYIDSLSTTPFQKIISSVTEKINEIGHILVKKSETAQVILKIRSEKKQEYLNVEGFEKWNYQISFINEDSRGNQYGELTIEKVIVGRNDEDCILKFENHIQERLVENFYKLKI
ncbi:MAG: LPP20 family lipoprotein [Halobacteriovoraceae bacterium]|nr:LPP20 family lipoprotein [Halobacteriovoraceae bacterium]